LAAGAGHQATQERAHLVRVGPGRGDALLGASQFGRGHQLHGTRDLLGRLDGADSPPDVAEGGHARAWSADYAALIPCRATNSAFASPMARVSASRMSSAISRLLAMSASMDVCFRSSVAYRNSSKSRTDSTGRSSSRPWVPAKMMAICRSTGS